MGLNGLLDETYVGTDLRIGVIAHLRYPIREPFAGGLEMHTYMLAEKLAERGNDVTVFTSEGSTVCGAVHVCAPTAPKSADAEAYRLSDELEDRGYLRLMQMMQRYRFDIVHNNSLHHLPLTMAGRLSAPMLTTLHTPPFQPFEEAVKKAAAAQHQFVSVSDTTSEQWTNHLTVRHMIPNGVDLSRFSFHTQACRSVYAVWYGRIVPEKGLHFAIDAARIAGLPLRFAGPVLDREYFDEFIAPRLGPDIVNEGHLDHTRLARLIGQATVFLCTPRWEEPFGLVVAEALASGVPVASFARGAIPKILDANSGALARPDDAASLAQATLRAMRLSRTDCRRRAEMICDAELMIDRYVDLYAELTGKVSAFPLLSLPSSPPACAN